MFSPYSFSQGLIEKVNIKSLFIFREDMEKINVKFHDNGTVSFQQNKILRYVPEWSNGDKEAKIVVPNIPLLVGTPRCRRLIFIPRLELANEIASSSLVN